MFSLVLRLGLRINFPVIRKMNANFDALVIGGGPAGATTAALLAHSGWSVALIEKKSFPRVKVCGEFLSAATYPLLAELGIAELFSEQAGPPVKRVGWFVANQMLTADMPVMHNSIKWGRALGREHLDTALLNVARERGVEIWQPWTALSIITEKNYFICQLESKEKEKTLELTAPVLIMAQGSWEKPVIKRNPIVHKPSDLLAFKTHFSHSNLDRDLMSLISFPDGYGGLVHSNDERMTLSCCIRRERLQKLRSHYTGLSAGDAVLRYIRANCLGVDTSLSSAEQQDQWLAVGPISPGIRSCYQKDIFYVGNVAAEAHPIIAEGISMAMQSACLLAKCFIKHGKKLDKEHLNRVGIDYQKQWHHQFVGRIRAAALFAHLTMRPHLSSSLLPIIRRFPGILSFSAALSGKVKELKI